MRDVTRILSDLRQGDPRAAAELLPLVYDELRKLAAQRMTAERPDQIRRAGCALAARYDVASVCVRPSDVPLAVDLLRGSSLTTWSDVGYGYAVEKAETTVGWTYTMYEETWNYGFPQEMQHFTDCVQRDEEPMVTAEDGRAVIEGGL